jgi:hypothetical protein
VPKIRQNEFNLLTQSIQETTYTYIGEIMREKELKLLDQGDEYNLSGNPYSHF